MGLDLACELVVPAALRLFAGALKGRDEDDLGVESALSEGVP